ncbi:hypothetical protein [Paenibacillus sp. FSL W7-1332]|uniref:hypothetical protein n=1 Tax=Paenibacillus sp. FSL W7-1332 TaxID=2921702 RepID=UPI0030CDF7CD
MYEIFVLGELMTGDKHGYMLQEILKNAVPKKVRLDCLEQYLIYLETNLQHVTDFEAKITFYKPEPEKQRLQLLRVLDHRKQMAMTNIEWVKKEITAVKSEED